MHGGVAGIEPPPHVSFKAYRHDVPVAVVADGVKELEGPQPQVAQVRIGSGGACPLAEGGRPVSVVAAVLGDPGCDPVHGPR
eukprot:8659305-Lingulodinium_polyedra.AAC.1